MSVGPSWQWPQCPTPHCMFRSSETWIRSGATPRSRSACDRVAHHHLRPADERVRRRGAEARSRDQLRHDADLSAPAGLGGVDRHATARATARAARDRGGRRACGRRRGARSRRAHVRRSCDAQDDRPERREADPAGDDDHVAARRAAIGQSVPNGPRRPSTVPGSLAQIASVTAPTARTVRTIRRAVRR